MNSIGRLTIPQTSTSDTKPPYTRYHVTIPLPLRTLVITKRYTDFTTLHSSLEHATSASPPPLPSKSWFTTTISSPTLLEERRKELEVWLQEIMTGQDARWRNTEVWRRFLQLPTPSKHGFAKKLGGGEAGGVEALKESVTDPSEWVDTQIAMKALMHDARLSLARRDTEDTSKAQYELRADATRALTRVNAMLLGLERGVAEMEKRGKLGRGECRRRRDIVTNARREAKELERTASEGAGNRSAMALDAQKSSLLKTGNGAIKSGRIIGKAAPETDQTRELDNDGVLQLQQQLMNEQDQDVEALGRIIARQKEMSIAIGRELQEQDEILDALDNDVDRVEDKLKIANKRVRKIH